MPSDAETFLNHFDHFAGVKGEFFGISEPDERPALSLIVYRDVPSAGHFTAVTYGLSLVPHAHWTHARAELMICVRSSDLAWAFAIGEIAHRLRGRCPFHYLEVIRWGTAVCPESEMSAFVVFAPPIAHQDETTVQLSGYKVAVVHMYPVYEEELAMLDGHGPEWFFGRPGAFFLDVKRPRLTPPQ